MNNFLAFATVLTLSSQEIRALKIRDTYSLHKIVYSLFEKTRTDEGIVKGESSGILWKELDNVDNKINILIVSDRKPHQTPMLGKVETREIKSTFLDNDMFVFEVVLNPSKKDKNGKIVPLKTIKEVQDWFLKKSTEQLGFDVIYDKLDIKKEQTLDFKKGDNHVVQNRFTIKGIFKVTDKEKFKQTFLNGIGRGKSFGLGLLQILPLNNSI
ncbi:MAG: type I-E CRISPR-associated protein Cas6/Cse3/CasE [Sulfurihydrogenibium sp.]|nr:type I-E CRISPR-associated protein Cas6/Cse3/CasE [Sulfurihydrogenibium sp.]